MPHLVLQKDSFSDDSSINNHFKSNVIQGNRRKALPWAHTRCSAVCTQMSIINYRLEYRNEWYYRKYVTNNTRRSFLPSGFWSSGYGAIENGQLVRQVNTYNQSHTKALAYANQYKWKVGTLLAELMGTVKYLADQTKTLVFAIKAVSNPRWYFRHKYARKRLKNKLGITHRQLRPKKLADRWLEVNFAVMPLYDDVLQGANTYGTLMKNIDLFIVSVKAKATTQLGFNLDTTRVVEGLPKWTGGKTHEGHGNYTAITKLVARVTDPQMVALKGFQLDSPTVAWQAVPFSWLVDSVIPISTIFQAMQGPKGLSWIDGYTSEKLDYTMDIHEFESNAEAIGDGNWYSHLYERSYKGQIYFDAYTRSNLSKFPTVKPYIRLDQGAWNFTTLIALILSTKGGTGSYAAKH